MMPSSDACPGIDRNNTGWKKLVPGKCLAGIRVLSIQSIGKLGTWNVCIAILPENEPGIFDRVFQMLHEFIRKNRSAILISLAASDEQSGLIEVDILTLAVGAPRSGNGGELCSSSIDSMYDLLVRCPGPPCRSYSRGGSLQGSPKAMRINRASRISGIVT
jgi:hypothetical protein